MDHERTRVAKIEAKKKNVSFLLIIVTKKQQLHLFHYFGHLPEQIVI